LTASSLAHPLHTLHSAHTGTAGILAVGGSKPTVVATADGLLGVKKVMHVNLTADHRIVYGADAAEFLLSLKAVVEAPDSLLL
jgi:pyruvate dehydrogenase E2 component (dihydrolipoamide acetyltransferase)